MSVNPLLTNYNATGGAVFAPASGGSGPGGGVSQIVAGSNVTISPAGGTGAVTINAAGGGSNAPDQSFSTISVATLINGAGANLNISTINGAAPGVAGVSQIIAGANVTISPPGGTGAVTINAAGGGTAVPDITASTITLGAGATGGSVTMNAGPGGSPASLKMTDAAISFNVLSVAAGLNGATSLYDVNVSQTTGQANSGIINITDFSTINAPTMNLNISSINGAAPGGGGTVGPTITASTINLGPGAVGAGMGLLAGPGLQTAIIDFRVPEGGTSSGLNFQVGKNSVTNLYDATISQDASAPQSGKLFINNFKSIEALTQNLNISTINGLPPQTPAGGFNTNVLSPTLPPTTGSYTTNIDPGSGAVVYNMPANALGPAGTYALTMNFSSLNNQATTSIPAGITVTSPYINFTITNSNSGVVTPMASYYIPGINSGTAIAPYTQIYCPSGAVGFVTIAAPDDTVTIKTWCGSGGPSQLGTWAVDYATSLALVATRLF